MKAPCDRSPVAGDEAPRAIKLDAAPSRNEIVLYRSVGPPPHWPELRPSTASMPSLMCALCLR